MHAAPILDHAQEPDRSLVLDPMIEQNHAVGNILLNPFPSQFSFAFLGGNYGGDSFRLQPTKQTPKLRAQNVHVGKPGKQRRHGVQNHALGADCLDRGFQADEEPGQIVIAAFRDFASVNPHMIHSQLLASA